jgi:hypothetical protein
MCVSECSACMCECERVAQKAKGREGKGQEGDSRGVSILKYHSVRNSHYVHCLALLCLQRLSECVCSAVEAITKT